MLVDDSDIMKQQQTANNDPDTKQTANNDPDTANDEKLDQLFVDEKQTAIDEEE